MVTCFQQNELPTCDTFSPQLFCHAVAVMLNRGARRGKYVLRRTVVLLELEDAAGPEMFFKGKDMANVSAPPAVNRLVVVPYDTDVLVNFAERLYKEELRQIRILVFIYEYMLETALIAPLDSEIALEELKRLEEKVIEIECVATTQLVLIMCIYLRHHLFERAIGFVSVFLRR